MCPGDGTSGYRVLPIYAVSKDRRNRYMSIRSTLRGWAAEIDSMFSASAQGRTRHLRFVCNEDDIVVVKKVELSAAGDETLDTAVKEIEAKGYGRKSRKYLIWVDDPDDYNNCRGVAYGYDDEQPGKSNIHNGKVATYARVDITGPQSATKRYCGSDQQGDRIWWYAAQSEAHEIAHMLGAVGNGAPHSNSKVGPSSGHCFEEWDIMCYEGDGSGVSPDEVAKNCTDEAMDYRMDCGDDDYWNTDPNLPAANTYLADREEFNTGKCEAQSKCHWNIAWSFFFVKGSDS